MGDRRREDIDSIINILWTNFDCHLIVENTHGYCSTSESTPHLVTGGGDHVLPRPVQSDDSSGERKGLGTEKPKAKSSKAKAKSSRTRKGKLVEEPPEPILGGQEDDDDDDEPEPGVSGADEPTKKRPSQDAIKKRPASKAAKKPAGRSSNNEEDLNSLVFLISYMMCGSLSTVTVATNHTLILREDDELFADSAPFPPFAFVIEKKHDFEQ